MMIGSGLFFTLLTYIHKMIEINLTKNKILLFLFSGFEFEKHPDKQVRSSKSKFTNWIEKKKEKQCWYTQKLQKEVGRNNKNGFRKKFSDKQNYRSGN